jgi:hypothetical protein
MIDLQRYGKIEYTDFTKTIWKSGYKLSDLNRRLNKSSSYFSTCGFIVEYTQGKRYTYVKPRFIVEASAMIGQEMFKYCYEEVLKEKEKEMEARKQRQRHKTMSY